MATTQATRALYESMTTDELRGLEQAFRLDQARATSAANFEFGEGRLALIAEVLAARQLTRGE